ncbi:MAG: 4-hydroxythreonine-4-phosphate dehydrogenase PdxA [Pseudomonadota bacterium]
MKPQLFGADRDVTGESAPLVLTMGDPAGCGPQISMEAWRRSPSVSTTPFFVCGALTAYEGLGPIAEISRPEETAEAWSDGLPVLPLERPCPSINRGCPSPVSAPAILESIERAVAFTMSGRTAAVVTNPISKAQLYRSGFEHPGHTEFLAHLSKTPDEPEAPRPVMMMVGGGLRVALATIHIPLRDAPNAITTSALTEIGVIVDHALKRDFGIRNPRISFSGLNPHAGEDGALGREEIDIINPAADRLRDRGVDMADARPGDTVFAEALDGRFDAVIAMTHDQGLIPVKTLDFWGGVNTTLGLPFIRTSPDHGTAYDAAAAGTARPDSLIAAIGLAATMTRHRNAACV